MILPIGDHPNPRGAAPVTWALIAINVAIYVFVNLPLDFQPADPRDPAFPEYLEVVTEAARGQFSAMQLARQASAYDLFVRRGLAAIDALQKGQVGRLHTPRRW